MLPRVPPKPRPSSLRLLRSERMSSGEVPPDEASGDTFCGGRASSSSSSSFSIVAVGKFEDEDEDEEEDEDDFTGARFRRRWSGESTGGVPAPLGPPEKPSSRSRWLS